MKKTILKVAFLAMLLGITPFAMATLDSNSIIEDGIEYYIQTDKSVYNLGENVEMLYRVTNLGDEDVFFEFALGPEYRQCNFIVEKDSEIVWDTTGWPVTWDTTNFILQPLEFREYTQLWDMTDNDGNSTIPGNYDLTGVLNYPLSHDRYVPVSVQIEIIPDPSTLSLLAFGGLLLKRKN